MAELAQETESRRRQGRQVVGWQAIYPQAEIQDVLDGDTERNALPTWNEASTSAAVDHFVSNINADDNLSQRMEYTNNEEVLEEMEQIELDQVTETEIDSPVREKQNEDLKRKEKKTPKSSTTSQYSRSRQAKNKRKQVPKTQETQELVSNPAATIFDFSSDDDADMAPTFNIEEVPDGFEIEDEENQAFVTASMQPSTSTANEAFVTTRSTRTRKSSRQKSKIDNIPTPTAPIKKGSRKRVNRM